jgi:hypothetical protein
MDRGFDGRRDDGFVPAQTGSYRAGPFLEKGRKKQKPTGV